MPSALDEEYSRYPRKNRQASRPRRKFCPLSHSSLTETRRLLYGQYLARFNEVRKVYDPDGLYRSVVGEILGFYD